MSEQFISKIKFKEGQIVIVVREGDAASTERETTIKSWEDPHEDLRKAVSDLEVHVRDILELPATWAEGSVKITGVSFSKSEDTGVVGAVMTAQAGIEASDAPFTFNTPHLPFAQYSPTGNSPTMPNRAIEALEKVQEEALAFLNGKRAQMDMFSGQAA